MFTKINSVPQGLMVAVWLLQVMMEVVAVSSAIYGLLLSMIICVTAVAIFTGHILLLGIVVSTILGKIR